MQAWKHKVVDALIAEAYEQFPEFSKGNPALAGSREKFCEWIHNHLLPNIKIDPSFTVGVDRTGVRDQIVRRDLAELFWLVSYALYHQDCELQLVQSQLSTVQEQRRKEEEYTDKWQKEARKNDDRRMTQLKSLRDIIDAFGHYSLDG
jgi:hypothetical protein